MEPCACVRWKRTVRSPTLLSGVCTFIVAIGFAWRGRAGTGLGSLLSAKLNQWTLLAAMLPIVFSISRGSVSTIPLDEQQQLELLMTLGQSLVGMLFLVNMELVWWEAATLFGLWGIQFVLSPIPPGPGFWATLAQHIHWYVTLAYLLWFGLGVSRYLLGRRRPEAFWLFAEMWRRHVRPRAAAAVK